MRTLEEDAQSVAGRDYSAMSEDTQQLDHSQSGDSDSEEDTGSQLQQIKEDPAEHHDSENIDNGSNVRVEGSVTYVKGGNKTENVLEERESLFPDTSIQLQHVKGEK